MNILTFHPRRPGKATLFQTIRNGAMLEKPIRPAIRYHGGKWRMAAWIMQHFPAHTCYVEPFGGAASVLLQKERSYAEVYNDLDGRVVNFFKILRNHETCLQLIQALLFTPYSRDEFRAAWENCDDPLEDARRLAVRAQMGFGSAGATKGATGFRVDTNRKYGTAQQNWQEYPASLIAVMQRLQGVLIENRPATDTMRQHDAPDTLHYVDPPYMLGTRNISGDAYQHEMSDGQHAELLDVLLGLQGFVVLSGYDSDLYRKKLKDWHIFSTSSCISGQNGSKVKTEFLWVNPSCMDALHLPPPNTNYLPDRRRLYGDHNNHSH